MEGLAEADPGILEKGGWARETPETKAEYDISVQFLTFSCRKSGFNGLDSRPILCIHTPSKT